MGHRISRVYTRTGDDGTTGLGNGERIDKYHPRIEAIGNVDELNSTIGLLLCETVPDLVRTTLTDTQHRLFDLGGELCLPDQHFITPDMTLALEDAIERSNSELPPLKEFILPGGGRPAALCHLARAVCRRAERSLAALAAIEDLSLETLAYLNRLSDLLFVYARVLSRQNGNPEHTWVR